jgi:hypothetical protein
MAAGGATAISAAATAAREARCSEATRVEGGSEKRDVVAEGGAARAATAARRGAAARRVQLLAAIEVVEEAMEARCMVWDIVLEWGPPGGVWWMRLVAEGGELLSTGV